MQISGKARRWRAGAGLVLGIVVPALIVTACTAEENSAGPTRSGTATATASSVSKAPSPTTPRSGGNSETTGNPGGGGQPQPGGTDTCGATLCGTTDSPTPPPGGTDTCGATLCGTTDSPTPPPGGTDTCGATSCGTTENPAPAPGGTDTCGATFCGTTDPQPTTLWDPCEQIPAAAISGQGLRADSKAALSGSGGVNDKNCRWQSDTGAFELTVVATRQTIQDFEQSRRYVDFGSLTVGGRPAYQYRAAQDTNKIGCYIGFTVPDGQIAFVIRNLRSDAAEEPCVAARRLSGALVGYLP